MVYLKRIFCCVAFIALPTLFCMAQKPAPALVGQPRIDSLVKQLNSNSYNAEDSNKVKLLVSVSNSYAHIKPDEGIKYAQQAISLSEKLQWEKGMAIGNMELANNYQAKSEYDKALEYDLKALAINEGTGNKLSAAKVTSNIGIVYQNKGNYTRSVEYSLKALNMYEVLNYKPGIANVTGNIAIVYLNQGRYAEALEFDIKSLKIAEEMGNKSLAANCAVNMASVYYSQGDFTKALEYGLKAIKLNEAVGNKFGVGAVTLNMAAVYYAQGDYPKTLEYDLRALKIFEEIGNKNGIATANGNIGIVYNVQKDYPKALAYFSKSLKLNEEIGDKQKTALTLGNMGNAYRNQKDYDHAVSCHIKATDIAKEIGDKHDEAENNMNLGEDYAMQKNYTMAIALEQKALQIDEEIGNKHSLAKTLISLGETYLLLIMDTAIDKPDNNKTAELPTGEYLPDGVIPASKAGKLHMAIAYLQRGLDSAKKIQTPDAIQRCYENLAKAYKLSGDYKKALDANENYHSIKDSVFSKENNEKIVKMGMENEYGRQRLADSVKAGEKEKIATLKLQRQRGFTYAGVVGVLLLAIFSFFIAKERRKSEQERLKSDDLLLNILPSEIAAELKVNGKAAARHYDNVTVLFTDFVNFTQAGEQMPPQALIDELHICFKTFDEITGRYGIEKIKTIGDAYLAVAGLPAADPDHAENIVRAATEICTFVADRHAKLGNRTFEVRIGIHSGSVVAGIVGVKKFAYDIWGDTVNTAARMEQNSEPGKINISQTTYELVKNKFACTYRGEIEAKNKGGLSMYFVGYA